MNQTSKHYSIQFFDSVQEIPITTWNELECKDNIYFHPDYLSAIHENNSQLEYLYAIVFDHKHRAIAFSWVQIIDFYLDDLENSDQGFFHTLACLGRKLRLLPGEKPLKILHCGNPFVSGEHGFFVKKGTSERQLLRFLTKEIVEYSQHYFSYSIDIYMMKDFLKESLPLSNELISLGYYAFNVEPNMRLDLHQDWNTFEDYLAALKTKFRVKAKKALSLSKELIVESISEEQIGDLLKTMTELYLKVSSKASFNLAEFRLKTYASLKQSLGERYVLQSYRLNDRYVGFLSGVVNGKSLDAHFVGIDYELNKTYGIYQRMLYDYIHLGIDQNLETINFGRTASEIKSSVGATPEHLTVYIRHKKTITNKFLRLFLQRIQPSEFSQKHPFKKVTPVS